MKVPLARRILARDKGRSALAIAGVFMAVVLVFVELGFFVAVPQGGMLFYDHMRFQLLMCSKDYEYQGQPHDFPLARLDAAGHLSEVAAATPVYFATAKWRNDKSGKRIDTFLIAAPPGAGTFDTPDIARQRAALERPDTMLVDSATRPMFGPLDPGRRVELDGHPTTIAGTYKLGTGFLGLGVALISDQNLTRLFPYRPLDHVNLGLIRLKTGADPDKVAAELRKELPADTRIFTRAELTRHEIAYWTRRTSVGLIFGSGLVVAVAVGVMVLYQILWTQVSRRLRQFATLKAVGYGDGTLAGTVVRMALIIVVLAFVPAALVTLGIYGAVRDMTLLPVEMTAPRLAAVFALTLAMAVASALLPLRSLRRADPADLF